MKLSNLAIASVVTLLGVNLVGCTTTNDSVAYEDRYAEDQSVSHRLTLHTIYFDFDRYNIRADQQDKASAMARSISGYVANHPNLKIQIQGNTDDRGSVEYNMALGTRRAEALKDYLVSSGVNSSIIDTVSYGKERPAVQGADESSWAQNRRDDVVVLDE